MNLQVTEYIRKAKSWQAESQLLRDIILDCHLVETLKWGVPCYTYKDTNIVIIGLFKDYCSISFLKGVLLKDTKNILISPGENSQSVKYLKFTSLSEIEMQKGTIKKYIFEALVIEESGLKIDKTASKEFELVEELQSALQADSAFEKAFKALTIGRQRAYNMYFAGAKQAATRVTRIESSKQRIFDGYGINDCTCGMSKRMPNCDGSHKFLVK